MNDRFEQTGEEIEVVLTPQCCYCAKNLNREECSAFKEKPEVYLGNGLSCPKYQPE